MSVTLAAKKDLTYDGLSWIFLMIFLSMLSFSMLTRDMEKQYGAVSFGVFPAFHALDSVGEGFDQHRLHGQLSAIVVTDYDLPQDIMSYLQKLSQATSRGTKQLRSFVLVHQVSGVSNQWMQYLKLDEAGFNTINSWRKGLFKDGVILVDQNGVIRGVFDLENKLERFNFEGAVKGIL
jgi:hypothetical protein